MASFNFVSLILMAVLVGSTLAQSPAKSPTQAPTPKASAPSPTVVKTPVSPPASAPSPTVVKSPPSPPPVSSEAPGSPPVSIASPPSEAPGPANGAVLNRVGFAGSVGFAVVAAAVLVF
ncbi:classical arabinogalactan protein 1-like [Fagus crenata]